MLEEDFRKTEQKKPNYASGAFELEDILAMQEERGIIR